MIRLKSLSLFLSLFLSKRKEKERNVDNERVEYSIVLARFSRVILCIVVGFCSSSCTITDKDVALKRRDRWRGGRKMSSNGAILGALIRRLTAEH